MSKLHQLSYTALSGLATALETKRLQLPLEDYQLSHYLPQALCHEISNEFQELYQKGTTTEHLVYTLRLLAEARQHQYQQQDRLELVWTGPEGIGAKSRDPKVVVQELFESAKNDILMVSYAIEHSPQAPLIFALLAEKMDKNPLLTVKMCLNIHRPYQSDFNESDLLKEFAQRFRQQVWTGNRLPDVYYDVRSLQREKTQQSCLHAKCMVVDYQKVLITSANFTMAAHERNIEVGIIVEDSSLALALHSQFEQLINCRLLQPIKMIEYHRVT